MSLVSHLGFFITLFGLLIDILSFLSSTSLVVSFSYGTSTVITFSSKLRVSSKVEILFNIELTDTYRVALNSTSCNVLLVLLSTC